MSLPRLEHAAAGERSSSHLLHQGAALGGTCRPPAAAPDAREDDVRRQLARPAFRSISALSVKYLPYSELERNRDSMGRFGEGLKAIEAVARTLGAR